MNKIALIVLFTFLSFSVFAENIKYKKVLDSLGEAPLKTIKLLERFHQESGPVFRSTLLLATLYQKTNKNFHALTLLNIVPSAERTNEYWHAKLVLYNRLKHEGKYHIEIKDIHFAMNMVVENTSHFPDGLDEFIFTLLKKHPNNEIKSKVCQKNQFKSSSRCQ